MRGWQTEGCTSLPPVKEDGFNWFISIEIFKGIIPPVVEQFQLAGEQFQLELAPEGIVERSL